VPLVHPKSTDTHNWDDRSMGSASKERFNPSVGMTFGFKSPNVVTRDQVRNDVRGIFSSLPCLALSLGIPA
jgi:hypothetical protein